MSTILQFPRRSPIRELAEECASKLLREAHSIDMRWLNMQELQQALNYRHWLFGRALSFHWATTSTFRPGEFAVLHLDADVMVDTFERLDVDEYQHDADYFDYLEASVKFGGPVPMDWARKWANQ